MSNTPTIDELRTVIAELNYPGNQSYDPETLQPVGDVTSRRVDVMAKTMPQLLAGGESLLDIGSNKGFVAFWLRDKFREIHGYEMGADACRIAEAVRQHHGFEHIQFFNRPFRNIIVDKGLMTGFRTYDVVYCGSVHHHFFKDAMLHGASFRLPLKKLAALAERLLILDGPLSFGDDCSLNTWAEQYGWGDDVRKQYTLDAHVDALAPQFALVAGPFKNERGRETVVFERVAPNMPTRVVTDADLTDICRNGQPIGANKARDENAVIRDGGIRCKLDRGLQSDAVLMILNSLPDWFLHTREVLIRDGERIGDVADWVDGEPNATTKQIANHWLRMNDMLACIGLVEIHLKERDYVLQDGHWIDVDIDMVAHVDRIAPAENYLAKWRKAGAKKAFGSKIANYIADNLVDEWVFRNAAKKLKHFRGY